MQTEGKQSKTAEETVEARVLYTAQIFPNRMNQDWS